MADNNSSGETEVRLPVFNFRAVSDSKVCCDICRRQLTLRLGVHGCNGRALYVLGRHVGSVHRLDKFEISIHGDIIVRPPPRYYVDPKKAPKHVFVKKPKVFDDVPEEKKREIEEARAREAKEKAEQPEEPVVKVVKKSPEELKEMRRRRAVHCRFLRKLYNEDLDKADPSRVEVRRERRRAARERELARYYARVAAQKLEREQEQEQFNEQQRLATIRFEQGQLEEQQIQQYYSTCY